MTTLALFSESRDQVLNDFFTFLNFPSVSSEPNHQSDVRACGNWLKAYLSEMGFQTEFWETTGHPVLFASHLEAGPDKPTLLIYNHYDVQPIDPLELWESDPFKPEVRNGQIFARGAQDNKGQCFYVIQALKALLKRDGKLPVNVKLCIEGEEETGSLGLSQLLQTKKEQLKADYLAIVDLGIPKHDSPAITLGIRGILTMEVEVQGSKTDLHSGSHGGLAYNPIHALVELLAKLRDPAGHITVPGFYDDVVPLNQEELSKISFNFDCNAYKNMFGINPTGGEKALSPLERAWVRPALEINGISGGYTGAGLKTVIPAKASAKISCRLVPNQDPEKVAHCIASFLKQNVPEGITLHVDIHEGGGTAVRTDPSSKIIQAFAQAYSETFQKPCEYVFEGASIPIVPELAAASESEVALVGLGLPGDQIHAPNEHFSIDRLEKGFLIISRTLELLGNFRNL